MSKRVVTLWRLLPVLAVFVGGSAAAQNSRTTIHGQVTDSTNQQPLAGVEIIVAATDGAALSGARTDGSGRYVISNVPAGTEIVSVPSTRTDIRNCRA